MGINDSVILAADVDLVYAGILGLIFIMVIVFSVMAAKTWHWVNIVFLILTFMAGTGAIMGMTTVYHLRTTAMKQLRDAKSRADRLVKAENEARKGKPDSPVYDPGSLRAVSDSWTRLMYGRGRVWSGGQVTAEGNNRVFAFNGQGPAGNGAAALQDSVMFAFLDNNAYPVRYIGSVRVIEETPQTVKLEPIALADSQEFNEPTGSWSLFEKMPQDRRRTFKQATISAIRSSNDPSNENEEFAKNLEGKDEDLNITLFREVLINIYLPADQIGYDADSEEYEKLIDNYAFDGLPLGKIQNWIDQNSANRKNLRFVPIPDEVFVRFRFNEDSKTPIIVDSSGNLAIDGVFSRLGLAIVAELKLGHPINFKKGDEILVDQPSVDGYMRGVGQDNQVQPFDSNHDVVEIGRIFVRQMRDFPYEFGDIRIQTDQVAKEILRIEQGNIVQEKTLADTETQYAARVALVADSDSDQSHLKIDLARVNELAKELAEQEEGFLQTISAHETKIDEVYEQLRALVIQLSKKAFAKP